jgi:hypothetical protein
MVRAVFSQSFFNLWPRIPSATHENDYCHLTESRDEQGHLQLTKLSLLFATIKDIFHGGVP